ncbi:MAG: ribosome biogenesis GTPase, partial [Paracoccaceae bacterium]
MKRDYSTLKTLGWQPYFAQQVSEEERTEMPPVRVTEVHRSSLRVIGDDLDTTIP